MQILLFFFIQIHYLIWLQLSTNYIQKCETRRIFTLRMWCTPKNKYRLLMVQYCTHLTFLLNGRWLLKTVFHYTVHDSTSQRKRHLMYMRSREYQTRTTILFVWPSSQTRKFWHPQTAYWALGQLATGETVLSGNVLAAALLTWAGICLYSHLDCWSI